MKIAVLSDIHSNVFALEAVFEDIYKRGAEAVINLGDILYGPIAPESTYELLKARDLVTVSGNQDRMIHEASAEDISANPTLAFILDELGEAPVAWLKSLPFDWLLDGGMYLCHGTPADDTEYLLEDIGTGVPVLRDDAAIRDRLGNCPAPVILCGHTHLPRTVMTDSGQLIVNPGSVGLPAYTDDAPVVHSMENFSPHAAYVMMETDDPGWHVHQIRVPYNHVAAADAARKRNREDWAHFLTTGRGLKP